MCEKLTNLSAKEKIRKIDKPVLSADGIFSPLDPSLLILSAKISSTTRSPIYIISKKNGCCYCLIEQHRLTQNMKVHLLTKHSNKNKVPDKCVISL
jgi:hypothetical protein